MSKTVKLVFLASDSERLLVGVLLGRLLVVSALAGNNDGRALKELPEPTQTRFGKNLNSWRGW
jgi:hypothetical protein